MPKKRAKKLEKTKKVKKVSKAVKAPKAKRVKKEQLVGKVTHFYDRISVGIVKLKAPVKVGEALHFKGKKTDFTQPVVSMQFEHAALEKAPKGKEVGVKVSQKVHEGDQVFRA